MSYAHSETILEARLLDLEVLLQELELLLQRHSGRARSRERHPEQVAQPADHPVGRFRLVHQRRDRVQRVEEEVRVELRLEGLQAGLASRASRWAALIARSCDSR